MYSPDQADDRVNKVPFFGMPAVREYIFYIQGRSQQKKVTLPFLFFLKKKTIKRPCTKMTL